MNVVDVRSTITCFAALADHLEQLLLELGRRVEVDLAGERDHVGVVGELFGLDVEVHLWPLTGASLTVACGVSLTGR